MLHQGASTVVKTKCPVKINERVHFQCTRIHYYDWHEIYTKLLVHTFLHRLHRCKSTLHCFHDQTRLMFTYGNVTQAARKTKGTFPPYYRDWPIHTCRLANTHYSIFLLNLICLGVKSIKVLEPIRLQYSVHLAPSRGKNRLNLSIIWTFICYLFQVLALRLFHSVHHNNKRQWPAEIILYGANVSEACVFFNCQNSNYQWYCY